MHCLARAKGIIAYGKELDRQKLLVLATLGNKSASEWVIDAIRSAYKDAFGETDPKCIIPHTD